MLEKELECPIRSGSRHGGFLQNLEAKVAVGAAGPAGTDASAPVLLSLLLSAHLAAMFCTHHGS